MKVEDQFLSKIALGVERYHNGAMLFSGGEEHRSNGLAVIKIWGLSNNDAEIVSDNGNPSCLKKGCCS